MTLLISVHPKALGAYAVSLSGEINGRTFSILESKLDQLLLVCCLFNFLSCMLTITFFLDPNFTFIL